MEKISQPIRGFSRLQRALSTKTRQDRLPDPGAIFASTGVPACRHFTLDLPGEIAYVLPENGISHHSPHRRQRTDIVPAPARAEEIYFPGNPQAPLR
ncbi:MAG: hypothetical protein K9N21_15485 [Deltaproteobacteria bacterium]|nr:hypothetical protein [Deltaproteobacteria bacterium]